MFRKAIRSTVKWCSLQHLTRDSALRVDVSLASLARVVKTLCQANRTTVAFRMAPHTEGVRPMARTTYDGYQTHDEVMALAEAVCTASAELAHGLREIARHEPDTSTAAPISDALEAAHLLHKIHAYLYRDAMSFERRHADGPGWDLPWRERQSHQRGHQPGQTRRQSHHRRTPPSTWQQEGGAA